MVALRGAAQTIVDANSQVRENDGACRTAHDMARPYRDEMVPLRKTISEEMAHRYNGY